ncbi:MAG TPA: pilus assembly protein N-terminal domain-containing protein [Pirellulales bacterium]|nr:pilus assembly protein N-terminal domain-containing protein [Pirellulales bacterium]
MSTTILRRAAAGGILGGVRRATGWLVCFAVLNLAAVEGADSGPGNQVIHQLTSANETLELTVNTSRILTIGKELPRVIVNNPEVAEVTPLSPTHIQVMAKKPGVTQINLFDAEDEIHSVDLIVYPDARELSILLRTQFPTAALKVVPTANAVIISGYVDDPSQVQRIVDIATDYAPKVLNNIRVGGVQQVLLQVKVMEISRTKLRNFGFDWGNVGSQGSFAVSGVGGLLNTAASSSSSTGAKTALGQLTPGSTQTFTFGVLNGANSFFGVLNLLVQNNVAKVLAEPQLVTVSGRPASFLVGGLVPYPASISLAGPSFNFRPIGTQVDFVPIVLGNGAIRLEVRPQVSELDPANSVSYNGSTIPGFSTRTCDTGVELRAGQTLALAGLVQQRSETQVRGLIWLKDLPLLGIPFRSVTDNFNEVETLIMVTPQLVDAMDQCEVPPGGPGYATTFPDDHDLYCNGHIEVPNCQGAEMLGPYPDSRGMFPPVSKGDWDESKSDKKPKSNATAPSTQPAQSPAEVEKDSRRGGSRTREVVDRPKPPTLSGGKAPKTNSAGFVRFEGPQTASAAKPTVKASTSRQKKTPGFIGPTGYDLR